MLWAELIHFLYSEQPHTGLYLCLENCSEVSIAMNVMVLRETNFLEPAPRPLVHLHLVPIKVLGLCLHSPHPNTTPLPHPFLSLHLRLPILPHCQRPLEYIS